MLFNWVKNSGHSLGICKPRARWKVCRSLPAVLLGIAAINSAIAAPAVLTFAQLASCQVDNLAPDGKSASPSMLPEKIRSALGQQVQVTGYMLPLVVENGRARQLLLMRNTMACCYGQSPVANEYLVVKTPAPGVPVTLDVPVALQGTLRIEPVMMGGLVIEYFHLDDSALAAR